MLNFDNSIQKMRKSRCQFFLVLSNFPRYLHFVPSILSRIASNTAINSICYKIYMLFEIFYISPLKGSYFWKFSIELFVVVFIDRLHPTKFPNTSTSFNFRFKFALTLALNQNLFPILYHLQWEMVARQLSYFVLVFTLEWHSTENLMYIFVYFIGRF